MSAYSKWFSIAAIVLMLLAMFAYVASDDEAIAPAPPNAEQGAE